MDASQAFDPGSSPGYRTSLFFKKKKKMSDNIFNQNQNSLAINNNIMDYEPNVNSGSSKVILGIEKS